MQLKVNRRQQKQEKSTLLPFLLLFSHQRVCLQKPLKFSPPPLPPPPPPPCWLSAFPDNVMQVDNIEDEQSRHHRGGCRAGEVKKYSFQIGFSPPFTICWIVLIHGAQSGVRSGRGRQPCTRETIERVREEPSVYQINSSRRGEAGPGWGLGDTCLSDGGLLSCPLRRTSTFLIWFSLAAHAYYCELPEIGVTKGGWKPQRKEVDSDFLRQLFRSWVPLSADIVLNNVTHMWCVSMWTLDLCWGVAPG